MFDYLVSAEEGPFIPTIKMNLKKEGFIVGQFILIPHSPELYEIHLSMMDRTIKGGVVEICKAGLPFLFKDISKMQKLIAYIPVTNRLAIRLANQIGMKHEGTLHKSYDFNQGMVDQDVYGISREDICL